MNDWTDVRTGAETGHGTGTGRRLVRWVTVLTVGILTVLAVWQDSLS